MNNENQRLSRRACSDREYLAVRCWDESLCYFEQLLCEVVLLYWEVLLLELQLFHHEVLFLMVQHLILGFHFNLLEIEGFLKKIRS